MALKSMPFGAKEQRVRIPQRYENIAWRWMRYSGVLLIPLVWIHALLQDALTGVHKINLDYVAVRWASVGWRVYDVALLSFAFAHGMNGLRQVLWDVVHTDRSRAILSWGLFLFWLVLTLIGGTAIIGGVR